MAQAILAALALHELAHLSAAHMLGVPVTEFDILPFGAAIRTGGEIEDALVEASVSMSGPLASLLVGAAAALLGAPSVFQQTNFGLGLLNLVPAYPLDGGRLARLYLARRHGIRQATRLSAQLGRIVGLLLILLALVTAIVGRPLWTALVIGGFVWAVARAEEDRAMLQVMAQLVQKERHLLPAGIMPVQEFAAGPETTLREVLDHLMSRKLHRVCVVGPELLLLGQLTEADLMAALAELGPQARLREVLERSRPGRPTG